MQPGVGGALEAAPLIEVRPRAATPPLRRGDTTPPPLRHDATLAATGARSEKPTPRTQGAPDSPEAKATPPWVWPDDDPHREVLQQLYSMIDKAGSGNICTTELGHILLNLGEDVSDALVDEMVDLVDTDGDQEISFDEFFDIMTGKHGKLALATTGGAAPGTSSEARVVTKEQFVAFRQQQTGRDPEDLQTFEQLDPEDREKFEQLDTNNSGHIRRQDFVSEFGSVLTEKEHQQLHKKMEAGPDEAGVMSYHTKEIRYLFDQIDEDGGGTLDRDEVAALGAKMGQSMKRRHLVDAMSVMDPENTGDVTFDMFKNWLIDTGRHWSDLLVLPEGSVSAVRDTAEQLALLPGEDDDDHDADCPALVEWQRLSVLMRLMGSAIGLWGKPSEMYGLHILELEKKIARLQKPDTPQDTSEQDIDELMEELRKVAPRSPVLEKSKENTLDKLKVSEDSDLGLANAEDIEKEAKLKRFFFPPNGAIRTTWDMCVSAVHISLSVLLQRSILTTLAVDFYRVQVFLLAYLLIVIPLRIGFSIEVEPFSSAFWFDVAVDVYFLVDIAMNFRTPYYDPVSGLLVISQREISWAYARSWLLIDVVTCIPVSYIMMMIHGVEAAADGKQLRMLKSLRLMKLAKLMRITRIKRMLERHRERLRVVIATWSSLLLCSLILLFCHLIACIWYATGVSAQSPAETEMPGGKNTWTPGVDGWVYRRWGQACDDDAVHWSEEVVVDDDACVHPGTTSRYITAFYWALMSVSTVGYGDITANTDWEMMVTCLTMLFGALVFAGITGMLSARMMSQKGAIQLYNTKMDEVLNYVRDMKIPTHMRRRVESHYLKLWETKAIYNEQEILQRLPIAISGPVIDYLYMATMSTASLFTQQMDPSCPHGQEILVQIATQLSHEVATPNTCIIRQGEYGSKMYLIGDGEVDVYRTLYTVGVRLGRGERSAVRNERGRRNAVVQNATKDYASFPSAKRLALTVDEMAATDVGDKEGRKKVRLGRLGQKGFFGESAVMHTTRGVKTSAWSVRKRTIIARVPCSFHVLEKEALDRLRHTFPKLDEIMARIERKLDTPFEFDAQDSDTAQIPAADDLMTQLLQMKQEMAEQQASNESKLEQLIELVQRQSER